jgi:hypothetical protein
MARRGAKALAGRRISRLWAGITDHEVSKPPWEQESDLKRRRSGLKPTFRTGRALRWLCEGRKKRWNPEFCGGPALHREAERDTTGS